MDSGCTAKDGFYKMDASPRGICLIINNFKFEVAGDFATGPADKRNLIETFDELNFKVRYFENLTSKQIKKQMEKIQETDHAKYDCFVCCIGSHGNTTGVLGQDDKIVEIIDLREYVYSTKCPSLKGKPKLFFVDACRGTEDHEGVKCLKEKSAAQAKQMMITNKRDFLVSFATTLNNVAYCDSPRKGSFFFYRLTGLLQQSAKSETITEILDNLNTIMTRESPPKQLQTAEYTSSLAKKLCFYSPVDAMARIPVVRPSRPTHPQTEAFRFHDNHGKYVWQSDDQKTAQYDGGRCDNGIVMSRDPMEVNKLYEVKIKKIGAGSCAVCVGVVTSSPDRLRLPHVPAFWESAVTVYGDCFYDHGVRTDTDIGEVLWDFPEKSRVGVSVRVSDHERRLHLHVDGADQGIVLCRPLPDPCWAMWELSPAYQEMKTCAVTKAQYKRE